MAKTRDLEESLDRLLQPYRITDGRKFRLKDIRPGDTRGLKSKAQAKEQLAEGIVRLADLQEKLYAQDQWGVLLIFQAMDAAGKDGAIAHVMSGVNPQGCQVSSFKAPSAEELDHDFLWRTTRCLPERGRIGIFNRSYYEEMLVVRVHPEILEKQRLPKRVVSKKIWKNRFEDVAAFERYLARNGYAIVKFFLHVSKKEQKARFLERLDEPSKNWKFSLADAKEREYLGRLHGSLRGRDSRHGGASRPLVRAARRQQVVHTARRGRRHPADAVGPRPEVPGARRGQAGGTPEGAHGSGGEHQVALALRQRVQHWRRDSPCWVASPCARRSRPQTLAAGPRAGRTR